MASHSPRRHEILTDHNIKFNVISHQYDETLLQLNTFPSVSKYVKELAKCKAMSINFTKPCWILAADTVVFHKNHLLPKPSNLDTAVTYLNQLANSTHQVYTAFCLFNPYTKTTFLRCDSASLTFNPISKAEIQHYVNTKRPLDKAGGYGLQEIPTYFVRTLSGSKYTVIGLPIYHLKNVIKHIHNNNL